MHLVVVMHPEKRLGNGRRIRRVQALAIRLERVDVLQPMQSPFAVYVLQSGSLVPAVGYCSSRQLSSTHSRSAGLRTPHGPRLSTWV